MAIVPVYAFPQRIHLGAQGVQIFCSQNLQNLLPGIAAGCLFAWLASLLQGQLPQAWLRRAFGILLILTGIRELQYKVRE